MVLGRKPSLEDDKTLVVATRKKQSQQDDGKAQDALHIRALRLRYNEEKVAREPIKTPR